MNTFADILITGERVEQFIVQPYQFIVRIVLRKMLVLNLLMGEKKKRFVRFFISVLFSVFFALLSSTRCCNKLHTYAQVKTNHNPSRNKNKGMINVICHLGFTPPTVGTYLANFNTNLHSFSTYHQYLHRKVTHTHSAPSCQRKGHPIRSRE